MHANNDLPELVCSGHLVASASPHPQLRAHGKDATPVTGKTLHENNDPPEIIFQDAWQHQHFHIHSFKHVAAAGHAGTEGPGRQLRHGQVRVVALVVPHNDGTGFPCPSVNDVACTCVGFKA